VKVCPSCGHDNADDARFCSQCATSLDQMTAAREERKVVTCLFCDLVGFTARAESMDPEDVRRLLQPYHAHVRSELERFGGTVEKFIGDAVMAVFGAPVTHEDDPERAVRAALAIREWAGEEELELRIGITTGEALVALGARPEAGEGMASGDVVNTAARLQAAAPTNGILVDETTFRATGRAIEYGDAAAIEAKGKAEPVPVWEVQRARARVAVERTGGAALVGRAQELTLLRETLARVVREREPQLVTLVGVPGIGKSRLVYELFQTIETGEHGLVFWRHGRSLPYGDGVTFWALGEMVKAQAGILESDTAEQAGEKLRQAVERFVEEAEDASWIERRLQPLVGLEAEDSSDDRRDESFAAWRRFLEAIAEERPLVLVFEDLHWADEVLLDFVDYLVDWARGVPVLVLGTARPELLVRRQGWGGGKVNSATILLSPLSDDETAALVHELLGIAAIEADLQARLLEHAGGNPLYAEEFTRMLLERPEEAVVPENVNGMIAARLDTLPVEEKALLQNAAVIGRTFWLGALGRERWELEEQLHSLMRKEFVTRNRRSSVAGEDEYVFRHALMREVAYEQIPRAERAARHQSAAEWIDSLGRPEDHAEMVAHHYTAALEYARTSGQPSDEIAGRARAVLVEAGDRAFALSSFAASARFYGDALALITDTTGDGNLGLRRARALFLASDAQAEEALEEARAFSLAAGDVDRAAEADSLLAQLWWFRGDRELASTHLDRAHKLLADRPASESKAQVLGQVARYRMLAHDNEVAIETGNEAIAMAEMLGLDEVRAETLDTIGVAKVGLGDASGLVDVERSIELAEALGSPEAARGYNNLGACAGMLGDLRRSLNYVEAALVAGERFGDVSPVRFSRTFRLWLLFRTGAWSDALEPAEEFLAACEAGESHYHEAQVRVSRAFVRIAHDDVDGAVDDVRAALPRARQAYDPQNLVPALAGSTRLLVEAGRLEEARTVARETLAREPVGHAAELAWVADELDLMPESRSWLQRGRHTRWADAASAILGNDFLAAADIYQAIGDLPDEARARSRAAGQLALEGRRADADEQIRRALAFWRSVGATRYIRECEALLADASEISA
jgi:class 3 adenylate cyclase/tetratricopeptide (TPR) repeat protein